MPASVDHLRILTPREVTGPVVVRFGEEYVWSFHPQRDGVRDGEGWAMAWPDSVLPRLSGTTRVRLGDPTGADVVFDQTVSFQDDPAPLELRDRKGRALAIDKWGKLTRVFAETGSDLIAELMAGTARAIEELRTHVGVDAHINYGALLGAVRDGRLIGHDNDTDLAYLSQHTHPSDVITESYRMEREMRALGWKLVRMSAADLKLYFPMSDGAEAHIDIFGAFYVGDTFYLLGDTSGQLPRDVITPLGVVVLEGVELAAPRDPEAMLAFLYGDAWRIPDPAFSREWPLEGIRRLDGWLRGQRHHIKEWNQILADPRRLPVRHSSFGDWVEERLPEHAGVVDVGCGNGRDAQWFARRRPVVALDYAGTALRKTRRKLMAVHEGGPEPDVFPLPLNDFRAVAVAGADLARKSVPHHLYARHLLGCLDTDARHNLWRLADLATRRGGTVSLEFPATGTDAAVAPELVARLDPDLVVSELRERGFAVVDLELGPGHDVFDQPDPSVARLHVRRTDPKEQ